MNIEKKTLELLTKYLVKNNYPESSFQYNYKMEGFYIDLAIMDYDLGIPLQVFFIQPSSNTHLNKESVKRAIYYLTTGNIPAYSVSPHNNPPYILIENFEFDFDKMNVSKEIIYEDVINYNYHKQLRYGEMKVNTIKKKKKAIDVFSLVCWILSFLITAFLILIKFLKISINATDLTLLGSIVLLIIIPFANKIKFLGLEFERLEKLKIKKD